MTLGPLKILGHRGGRKEVSYENSAEAFKYALENLDGFEADACRTSDNNIFLIHETLFINEVVYELERHLDTKSKEIVQGNRIEELSTEQASCLILKNKTSIPQLNTVLKEMYSYPNAILNLELKGEDTARASAMELKIALDNKYITKEQIIVSSFNHQQLQQIRELIPEIKVGILFAGSFQPTKNRLYPWSNKDKNFYMPYTASLLNSELIKDINPDFFNLEYTDMIEENIKDIKKIYPESLGMTWWLPETENHPSKDKELWTRVISSPVKEYLHTIISDYPLEMKNYYEKNYR